MTAEHTPGPLSSAQFSVIADIIRSREPARTAAEMVLVRGKSNKEASVATGLTPQSVSNTLTRYRTVHAKLMAAYAVAGPTDDAGQ